MTKSSSEQSVWVSPGIIGNEVELGYDVLRGVEMAKTMSESLRIHNHRGDKTLRKVYGNAAIEQMGQPVSIKDYVVRDVQSGLYLKSYPDVRDAELQFAVMNTLADWLSAQDVGVRAVRHFALVERAEDIPVAVIEPASGSKVLGMDVSRKEKRDMLRDVRSRLDTALGKRASRALVNDLDLMQNFGANVFVGDDDTYTLIDQPIFPLTNKKKAREIVIEAGWPMPLQTSSWVDLFSFDPHDAMRAHTHGQTSD